MIPPATAVNITKLLIKFGIELNAVDHYGNTALDVAMKVAAPEVQEVLRHNGARKSSKVVSHYLNRVKKAMPHKTVPIVQSFHEYLPPNSTADENIEVLRYLL